MTVSSSVNKVTYSGNSVTLIFPVNYYFLENSHLQVILVSNNVETIQTITSQYTVTGAGNPAGGSVTMLTPPPTGTQLIIVRNVPATQETDYLANDPFPAESHERALDKLTMLVQQVELDADRALKIPLSSLATTSTELPVPSANKLLGWNSNASSIANIDPASVISIVGQQASFSNVFTGNGVTVNFTLDRSPGNANAVDVSVNGVTQVPNVDFILNGNILTFTTAPPAVASQILARYTEVFAEPNGDASNVRYVPAGSGAVATNVQAKLRETVSVKDFGAVGDGVVDDTAAIQAAIAGTEGLNPPVTLFFPSGIYNVSSALTITDALVIQGQDPTSTIVRTSSATADVFLFSIGATVITGCGVENINIISSVAKTGGAYINFAATAGGSFYKNFVKNVQTDANAFIGVTQNAGFFIDFENIVIGGVRSNGTGFLFQGIGVGNPVASVFMNNCRVLSGVSGGTTVGFSFRSYVEGFYCFGLTAESTGLDYGFLLDDPLSSTDRTPKNMWFVSCIGDNSQISAWYIPNAENVHLNSCWGTSCVTGDGLYLGPDAVDITVTDFTAIANGTNGIQLNNCATVKIANSTIVGNSAVGSNLNSGIVAKANTNDFIICNNRFGRSGATPSHFADIYIEPGTSNNYIIHDNNCDGFVSSSINDGGTGNKAKVHDNINYNPSGTIGFPSVGASPYTYTAGHTPETVYISGGTVSSVAYLGQPLFSGTDVGVPLGPNESIVTTYTVAPTFRVVRH